MSAGIGWGLRRADSGRPLESDLRGFVQAVGPAAFTT